MIVRRFFIDRCMGRRVFNALKEAGVPVEHVDELFHPSAGDPAWLRYVGEQGLIAITEDENLRYDHKQDVFDFKAAVFLYKGGNKRREEAIKVIAKGVAQIPKWVENIEPPFVARTCSDGSLEMRIAPDEFVDQIHSPDTDEPT